MFKVNHRNTRTMCEICSKLIKTPERRHRKSKAFCSHRFTDSSYTKIAAAGRGVFTKSRKSYPAITSVIRIKCRLLTRMRQRSRFKVINEKLV